MVLLVVESLTWPQIWTITGLGFGIVLLLLFCLVYILRLFGWIMQKAYKIELKKTSLKSQKKKADSVPSEPEKAAIAMAMASADDADKAAVAYALYLANNCRHDIPTSMINLSGQPTAWNEKTFGLNNKGF